MSRMAEDQVVHLPELSLLPGCKGCEVGRFGLLMKGQGEILKGDRKGIRILGLQFSQVGCLARAKWTLKIRKLNDADRVWRGVPGLSRAHRAALAEADQNREQEPYNGCGISSHATLRKIDQKLFQHLVNQAGGLDATIRLGHRRVWDLFPQEL